MPRGQIVEPAADAPQFDSEALWLRLAGQDWWGASVLVVRGARAAATGWRRACVNAAPMSTLAAYAGPRRASMPPAAAARRSARRAAAHLWLFSSSEAIGHLVRRVAGAGIGPAEPWRGAAALATHPRIARARARPDSGA